MNFDFTDYDPEKWYFTLLREKLEKAGLLNENNKPTGYWQIKYDKIL